MHAYRLKLSILSYPQDNLAFIAGWIHYVTLYFHLHFLNNVFILILNILFLWKLKAVVGSEPAISDFQSRQL